MKPEILYSTLFAGLADSENMLAKLAKDAKADDVCLEGLERLCSIAAGYATGECTMKGAPAKLVINVGFEEVNVTVWRVASKLWHWTYDKRTGKIKKVNTFLDITE